MPEPQLKRSPINIPRAVDVEVMPPSSSRPFEAVRGFDAIPTGEIAPYNPNQTSVPSRKNPDLRSPLVHGEGATRVFTPSQRLDAELAAQPIENWLNDPEKTKRLLDPRNGQKDATPKVGQGVQRAASTLLNRAGKIGGKKIAQEFLKWLGKRGIALSTLATGAPGAVINAALWATDVYTLYQALSDLYDILQQTDPQDIKEVNEVLQWEEAQAEKTKEKTVGKKPKPDIRTGSGKIDVEDFTLEEQVYLNEMLNIPDFELIPAIASFNINQNGFIQVIPGGSGWIAQREGVYWNKENVEVSGTFGVGDNFIPANYESLVIAEGIGTSWFAPGGGLSWELNLSIGGSTNFQDHIKQVYGTHEMEEYAYDLANAVPKVTSDPIAEAFAGTKWSYQRFTLATPKMRSQSPVAQRKQTVLPPTKKRRKKMDCCAELNRKLDQLQRDVNMIKVWVGADYKGISVTGNPFIQDEGITGVVPTGMNALLGTKVITNLPDLIKYYVDCLDGFFGRFPFTVKVPQRIVEAASESGETVPTMISIHNLQDGLSEIIKLSINLQDDERTTKALAMRATLEAYQAREEATKARNRIETVIDFLGFKYKEVMKRIRASFTIPGITAALEGLTGMDLGKWDETMGIDTLPTQDFADKQLEKFIEASDMPIKFFELDRGKGTEDLMDILLDVKQAISIIKHSNTVTLGGVDDMEGRLNSYLKDFETKVNKGAQAVKEKRQITNPVTDTEDEDIKDKFRTKDWKKFLEFAESGYAPPDGKYESPDGKKVIIVSSSGKSMPFGRTFEERPEIKDLGANNETSSPGT